MKLPIIIAARKWAVALCLFLPLEPVVAQYVELTAEIELNDWSYWFFEDDLGSYSDPGETPNSIFTKTTTVKCVVGANTWSMEGGFLENANVKRWFTGTNILEEVVITKPMSNAISKRLTNTISLGTQNLSVGERSRRVIESSDGNPGRPVRVQDLMELRGKVCWLAFCSGPYLKGAGHKIFPPSDLWKEKGSACSTWTEETTVFEDGLGLPKGIKLLATNNQTIFQYQIRRSTNVGGWNIPTEFYFVQYAPKETNAWELQLTGKGKVTSIVTGTKPELQAGSSERIPNAQAGAPAKWAKPLYVLHVGAAHNLVPITNAPESNPVHVFFKRWSGYDSNNRRIAIFGLTNGESVGIMLWNVRAQVPSKGKGTDGFGWDTIEDDYPAGTSACDFPAGGTGEFLVKWPQEETWRVCVLYSKENPGGKSWSGNYEVISAELKE